MVPNIRFFSNYCRSNALLNGKTVIITGGNCGIGARIILACRDIVKAEEAVKEIKQTTRESFGENLENNLGQLEICHLDLCSLKSVRKCAQHLLATEPKIHILINNAGVFFHPFNLTEDGFETHFQVNHLAHFLLTLLLLPRMMQSTPGCRIINLSSLLHKVGDIYFDDLNLEHRFSPGKAYCQSKLANVLFSNELNTQLRKADIHDINVYSLHPGMVNTELPRHVDLTMFQGAGFFKRLIVPFMKTAEQGAQTTIYCAIDEKTGKESGLYYQDCNQSHPSRKASDPKLAKQLWMRSCELLGLPSDLGLKELLVVAGNE